MVRVSFWLRLSVMLAVVLGGTEIVAAQKVVEVFLARDVVDREPVRPFEPGAYCELGERPTAPVAVVDSEVERRVFLWNRIEATQAVTVRHTWYREGSQVAQVDLQVVKSPRFRIWSSKKLLPKLMAGKWKVVVSYSSDPGQFLCVVHFEVK